MMVQTFDALLERFGIQPDPAITKFREELIENEDQLWWLQCLESAGVDNWGGYDYAIDLYRGEEE